MPSGKTLFQLLAERIAKLQVMVGQLPLYVMTSPLNHDETVTYFQTNDNFHIQVHFFQQGMLPVWIWMERSFWRDRVSSPWLQMGMASIRLLTRGHPPTNEGYWN
jgi:hypothetical protein